MTKPNHEATRAAFEDLIGGEPFGRPIDRIPNDAEKDKFPGTYKNMHTRMAWEAWKAAIGHVTVDKRLVSETLLAQLQTAAVAVSTIPQTNVDGTPEVLLDRARDLIQAAEDVLFENLRTSQP